MIESGSSLRNSRLAHGISFGGGLVSLGLLSGALAGLDAPLTRRDGLSASFEPGRLVPEPAASLLATK